MRRREFFVLAAGGIAAAPQIVRENEFQAFIDKIEAAVRSELPDVKRLEITYNPEDETIPLMIIAARV